DDDREMTSRETARYDLLADAIGVVCNLRDQNHVRRPCETRVKRDESSIAAHHFEHEDPIMRLGGRMQLVDRFKRGLHCSIEAKRRDGAAHVVVDRLGNADYTHSLVR